MDKKQTNPSDSQVQNEVELYIIGEMHKELGFVLEKTKIPLGDGVYAEIDGYSETHNVACEVWAHAGKPKGAQPSKIMKDALKLIFLEKRIGNLRKILVFSDDTAYSYFDSGKNWMSRCLHEYKFELVFIPLPDISRELLLETQGHQGEKH